HTSPWRSPPGIWCRPSSPRPPSLVRFRDEGKLMPAPGSPCAGSALGSVHRLDAHGLCANGLSMVALSVDGFELAPWSCAMRVPRLACAILPMPKAATSLAAQPQGPRGPAEDPRPQGPDGGCDAAPRVGALVTPISAASFSTSAMRFSVLGWVEKRLSMPSPERGLIMNRCAVAGAASAGSLRIW